MRCLSRNKQQITYCLYTGKTAIEDSNGNKTGEYALSYSAPVTFRANVSPATGISATEQFGDLDNYDKVIVTSQMNLPIDEQTVFFIDKPYAEDASGTPLFDYTVRRISRSLNSVSIAIRKVKVS